MMNLIDPIFPTPSVTERIKSKRLNRSGFHGISPEQVMKRSRGFTLVELLVVIGIIALLISILLPSLAKARSQANIVACQSNLRQIALASIMYANDNKGKLPPRYNAGGTGLDSGGANTVNWYSWLFTAGTPADDPGSNIARLLTQGYLGKPRKLDSFYTWKTFTGEAMVRFCPGQEPTLTSLPDYYGNSSYYFNPHFGYLKGTWPTVSAYPRLNDLPATKALVMDAFYDVGSLSHRSSNKTIINMAFRDGHAASVSDPFLASQVAGRPPQWNQWRWDDYRDYLETVAAGENPAVTTQAPDKRAPMGGTWAARLGNWTSVPGGHAIVDRE